MVHYLCGSRMVAMAALLSLAGGCARQPYARPATVVPPAFRADTAEAGTRGGSLADLKWQDLIRDDRLSGLIGEALANNLDAQIAAARVLEARAQAAGLRAARFPSLDAVTNYDNSKTPDFDSVFKGISAGLNWEIDLWHRIRNTVGAARAEVLAGEQARRAVMQSLVSDVAGAYFSLRGLDLEVDITRRALGFRKDSLELVRLRVDNGYSSEIELRQAEVLVKGALTALTGLELQREQTENSISALLGRNPGPIARGRSLLEQDLLRPLPPGLPSTLLDRRPDILEAAQQLIRDHLLVDAARAAWFPVVSLTASSGYASSALVGLESHSGTWAFSPLAAVPLFHAGAIRAGIRGAEARREQSLLVYRKTVQQAFREVADALAAQQNLAELRAQQESLADSLRRGVELADLAYKGGVVSYLEYLDANRSGCAT